MQQLFKKIFTFFQSFSICLMVLSVFHFYLSGKANAYPVFAQQNYANPREANGRIVCANCHLAQKNVEIEVPQAVLPDVRPVPYKLFL